MSFKEIEFLKLLLKDLIISVEAYFFISKAIDDCNHEALVHVGEWCTICPNCKILKLKIFFT